jgi:hypothetical protein
MRAAIFAVAIAIAIAGQATPAPAQRIKFDIATLVPPAGWQQSEGKDLFVFQDANPRQGQKSFGQIVLFRSRPTEGTPVEDFRLDWKRKVADRLKGADDPKIDSSFSKTGRTDITGFVTFGTGQKESTSLLITSSREGRTMALLINLVGDGHRPEVEQFFKDLTIGGSEEVAQQGQDQPPPPPAANSEGPAPAIGEATGPVDYRYTLPSGWNSQRYPDGVVHRSPFFDNGERCQISVFPIRPLQGTLESQLVPIFRQVHGVDPMQTEVSPLLPMTVIRGLSPLGWPYLMLRHSIGGHAGDYGTLVSRGLLLIQVGNKLGVIATTSKDPQVSRCFGTLAGDQWPAFFASLSFTNWRAPTGPSDFPTRLAGTWTIATGTVADQYTFAPNGRYASAAAAMQRNRISSTEILQTTQAYFGDGKYTLEGNALTLTPDKGGAPTTHRFRLEQESADGGRTWRDRLCLFSASIGEVCYNRDR